MTSFDWQAYTDAIKRTFEKEFADIPIRMTPFENRTLPTIPIISVIATEFYPVSDQPATAQTEVNVQFEVKIFVSLEGNPKGRIEAMDLASRVSHLVKNQYWNVPENLRERVDRAQLISAEDYNFDTDVETIELWLVRFQQRIRLGTNETNTQDFYPDYQEAFGEQGFE